jgi:hypothetical protein
MTSLNAKARFGAPPPNRARDFRNTVERNFTNLPPIEKPLPPFAASIKWKRCQAQSRTLFVKCGSDARRVAQAEMEDEQMWSGDRPSLFAVLPFGELPSRYDWKFADGLDVAITNYGRPETDITLLHIAKLVLEAGARVVVVVLENDMRLLTLQRGTIWSR